jgi:hypothetical protein
MHEPYCQRDYLPKTNNQWFKAKLKARGADFNSSNQRFYGRAKNQPATTF